MFCFDDIHHNTIHIFIEIELGSEIISSLCDSPTFFFYQMSNNVTFVLNQELFVTDINFVHMECGIQYDYRPIGEIIFAAQYIGSDPTMFGVNQHEIQLPQFIDTHLCLV